MRSPTRPAHDDTTLRAALRHAVPGRVQRQPPKSALGIVVTYRIAEQLHVAASSLVMLSGGLFIAPSSFLRRSGTLADRTDKPRSPLGEDCGDRDHGARRVGLWQQSMPALLGALFCLGTHSTVFGPIKYALLPQAPPRRRTGCGNALIEAGTFLAILLGTILGAAWSSSPTARSWSAPAGSPPRRLAPSRRAPFPRPRLRPTSAHAPHLIRDRCRSSCTS